MMKATCLILMVLAGFSETEENAENETAEVADTTSGSQNPEDMEEEDKNNNQDCTDASGASSEKFTSADLTAGYHSIFNPTVSNSSSELSLVSRDENHIRCIEEGYPDRTKHKRRTKDPPKQQFLILFPYLIKTKQK